MKRQIYKKILLRGGLLVILFIGLGGSCNQPDDELKQTGNLIKKFAIRQNPAFGNRRIRFSGVIDGAGGDDVCACIKVCDQNGENCTSCVCSPSSCGKCD